MARPTLLRNRKFARLARALEPFSAAGGDIAAWGALELLWSTAYETGDETIGDAVDVETAARWRGPVGELVKALLEAGGDGKAGFIEAVPDRCGWYAIHDFWDHAPTYVANRRKREAEREERGVTLSELRSAAGKAGAAKRWHLEGNAMANDRQVATTPAPAPAPAPAHAPEEASCAEASSAPPDEEPAPSLLPTSPVVKVLPCVGKGGHEFAVTQAMVDRWRPAFPAVDIPYQLDRMCVWLDAQPDRRKTHRGVPAFITRWLGREQDKGGARPGGGEDAGQRVRAIGARRGDPAPVSRTYEGLEGLL